MIFLPYEYIVYETSLSQEEVLFQLKSKVEKRKLFRFSSKSDEKPYEGKFNNYSFKINRIISYRNPSLPRIRGKITKGKEKTIIKVRMRLPIFTIIFMFIWFGGVFFGINQALTYPNGDLGLFPLLFALLVGGGIYIGGFKYESNKSKKFLKTIFHPTHKKEKFSSN
jgi:hypothetical protein